MLLNHYGYCNIRRARKLAGPRCPSDIQTTLWEDTAFINYPKPAEEAETTALGSAGGEIES